MPDLDYIRAEIELQRLGISTASADALLERMLTKIDELCAKRDTLKEDQAGPAKGKSWAGDGGERTQMVRPQRQQSSVD
jgi:hypothetical protein